VDDVSNFGLLESALDQLAQELTFLGVDLVELTKDRQLICAEYGYGGGIDGSGRSPATTGAQVGFYSYYGIFGPYKRWAATPWVQLQLAGWAGGRAGPGGRAGGL
jgi:hypothetical protein